jgi:hypothetical protein
MNKTKMLETLPDFPALKKLAEALWQQDAQRRALQWLCVQTWTHCRR